MFRELLSAQELDVRNTFVVPGALLRVRVGLKVGLGCALVGALSGFSDLLYRLFVDWAEVGVHGQQLRPGRVSLVCGRQLAVAGSMAVFSLVLPGELVRHLIADLELGCFWDLDVKFFDRTEVKRPTQRLRLLLLGREMNVLLLAAG